MSVDCFQISQFSLFSKLKAAELEMISKFSREIHLTASKTLFKEKDETSRALFLIVEGRVSVLVSGVKISEIGAKDFFGELSLVCDSSRYATIVAETDVQLIEIPAQSLEGVLSNDRFFWQEVTKSIASRMVRQNLAIVGGYRDLQESHQKLLHAAKLASVGEMTSVIAHELNNPLTIISGHLEIAGDTSRTEAVRQSSIEKIKLALKRILKITTGLRINARATTEPDSDVDVNGVISDLLSWSEPLYKKSDIKLAFNKSESLPLVHGSHDKLQQVVLNLMSNSRDAMEDLRNKEIKITTLVCENQVIVEVEDNGPGIPKELTDKIFNTYFTTKPAGKGTGLGLSVVKSIVEAMGGSISIDQVKTGGACFRIVFPLKVKL